MRFALIGLDEDTRQLVDWLAGDSRHEFAGVFATQSSAGIIDRLGGKWRHLSDWESLLLTERFDAVIVSRDHNQDATAEQLRRLLQARVPLIVSLPAHSSMLVCYELDMIRQETNCPVLSFSTPRWSVAYDRLLQLVRGATSVVGPIEQVIIERWDADRSPEHVRELFARDMDLARPLAGDLTRLAAMAPTSEPAGYANLGVQLSGPSGALVRWSCGPIETKRGARLTIIGAQGRALLQMPSEADEWTLDVRGERSLPIETFSRHDGRIAVARCQQLTTGIDEGPTWQDACRAVELADSIQRSLEKGRTVELHYEDYTEQATFKGTMTSVGCGLLWASLMVLIVGVVLAGFQFRLALYWPHLLLIVLCFFLLLQLLRFVFPQQKPDLPANRDVTGN